MTGQAKMQSDASGASADVCAEIASAGAAPESPSAPGFEEERRELERVLAHPDISRSASLVRFLSFICAKYFDGQSDEIREYSIAVEALGRKDSSFDSHIDPIVRVTARALRKKLQEFYKHDGRDHALQIVLPLGHYVPQFVRREPDGAAPAPDANGASAMAASTEPARRRSALLQFLRARRLPVALSVLGLLLVPAIFFAGYYFGQTRHAQPQPVSESLKWGDPVWSDEFNGPAQQLPDPSKWTYDMGNQSGWGNHELEVYCAPRGGGPRECDPHRPNAFQDGAGHLVLRAERSADGAWTSARITTRGLKDFQYGRIEARMKLPVGAGLWPAFWMLGANFQTAGWPASGSVSIAENVSVTERTNGLGPNMIRSTLHGPRYYGDNGLWHDFRLPNGARVDDGSFHTYGIIWSPGMIQFYVDDPANVFCVQDASDLPEGGEWVFDHPFYLVMNLAVGGDWPTNPDATTPNPADMLVDYIRVYKIPPVSAPTIQWQPVEVKSGSSVATIVKLQAPSYLGRVHLACSTDPVSAHCDLGRSVLNFSDTLSQEDSLTISTDSFTDAGRTAAPPGRYKVTITATTISGNRSQLTTPFEVKNTD